MELPSAAASMYQTWWSFALTAGTARNPDGSFRYQVTDASAAASAISQEVGDRYAQWSPIGMSQLFALARRIGRAQDALNSAALSDPLDPSMVAEAPWSRPAAEQAAMPVYQARAEVSYTDETGLQSEGIFTVTIAGVPPAMVGSLRAQTELRVQDMLASPPGTGTPRSGTLTSVGAITLLAV